MAADSARSIILSIITPVFNGRKYINQCIENVAGQFFPGLEHLIMDGGSSDGTPEEVRSLMNKYSHIRLISEPDNGQSDGMNKGIRCAKGSILGFLNVDDYYEPDVLPRIPELFSGLSEPSFVCGNLNIWNPDGTLKHFNRPVHLSLFELLSNRFEWPYNPSAYFYHKSLHDLTGAYNESNHYCMDYEFILEAAQHIPLRHIDELWGNFCQVSESKTLNRFSNSHDEAVKQAEDLRKRIIINLRLFENPEWNSFIASRGEFKNSTEKKGWIQKFLRKYRALFSNKYLN